MEKYITEPAAGAAEEKLFDNWFDPVETVLRGKVRGFLETMIEESWRRPWRGRATGVVRLRQMKMAQRQKPAIVMGIEPGGSWEPSGKPISRFRAPG